MKMNVVKKLSHSIAISCGAAALAFAGIQNASATTNCVFQMGTKSMSLQASCSTDSTLLIPNGITLNGNGFKITAIDPPGGNFKGAVLTNAGKVAHVNNLIIRTNLADVCNADGEKVVGILLDHATGTLSGVNITINKAAGASVCPEGIAVLAQGLPFNPKSPFSKVTVKNSTLNYNQLAAVVGYGNVSVRVDTNLIKSLDTSTTQRFGVVLSSGAAKGYIVTNQILRHINTTVGGDPSYGVLLDGANSTTVLGNTLNFDDIAIRVNGGVKSTVKNNIIRSSTHDGILLDDSNGLPTNGNTIWGNDSQKNGQNGIHLQNVNGQMTKNIVKINLTERNTGSGILTEGTLNKVQTNTSDTNTGLDIADAGTGNLYSKNICNTSSGAPVDCPH